MRFVEWAIAMLDLIREQRYLHPSRPKFPLSGEFQYKNTDSLVAEVREQGYRFTGCYWMPGELWADIDTPSLIDTSEFVLVLGREWARRLYVYLPSSRCRHLLPSIRVGDGQRLTRVYPSASDLLQDIGDSWVAGGSGSHPLLPGFSFTGRVAPWSGSLWYQWSDDQGDFGPLGSLYWSRHRPPLDSPLGLINWDMLVPRDTDSIGLYPSRLEWGWVGSFTGFAVDWDYLDSIWYQYMSPDRRFFLLDSPPSSLGLLYWNYWQGLLGLALSGDVDHLLLITQSIDGTLELS